MDCREVKEGLSRFLDGEMDEGERAAVSAHRADCRACHGLLASHEALERVMAAVPEVAVAGAGRDRDDLGPPSQRRRAPWTVQARAVLASAAALALVALSLVLRGSPERVAGPRPSAAPAAAAPCEHAVRLGPSTYRVRVEGEATQLLSCSVSEGGGPSVEVDCSGSPP